MTPTRPPWRSTTWRTSASPRPTPRARRSPAPRSHGSKIRSRSRSGITGPGLSTENVQPASVRSAETWISAPIRGPYCRALESRLPNTPASIAGLPSTTGIASMSTWASRARMSAPSISTQSLRISPRSTSWRSIGSAPGRASISSVSTSSRMREETRTSVSMSCRVSRSSPWPPRSAIIVAYASVMISGFSSSWAAIAAKRSSCAFLSRSSASSRSSSASRDSKRSTSLSSTRGGRERSRRCMRTRSGLGPSSTRPRSA